MNFLDVILAIEGILHAYGFSPTFCMKDVGTSVGSTCVSYIVDLSGLFITPHISQRVKLVPPSII